MFDFMSFQEVVSDLYESGVKEDILALLYGANRHITVKMITPYGLSADQTFDKLVLQRDALGPIMVFNHVEPIGKQLLEEEP